MHHAHYNGLFASIARLGPKLEIVMSPAIMQPDSVIQMKQQRRVVCKGGRAHSTNLGTDAIVSIVQPDSIVAIATDVPGRTPMTFLGQKVIGSFGSARIAAITNSPVVLVTARRDASGAAYLQVEEPLEPSDFAGPHELLAEILRIHGEAVLAWPEALDVPTARWNHVEA
jgi:lauroyl/myristoyl acyltransferase